MGPAWDRRVWSARRCAGKSDRAFTSCIAVGAMRARPAPPGHLLVAALALPPEYRICVMLRLLQALAPGLWKGNWHFWDRKCPFHTWKGTSLPDVKVDPEALLLVRLIILGSSGLGA